jgi:hypothetical protein
MTRLAESNDSSSAFDGPLAELFAAARTVLPDVIAARVHAPDPATGDPDDPENYLRVTRRHRGPYRFVADTGEFRWHAGPHPGVALGPVTDIGQAIHAIATALDVPLDRIR